MQSTLKLLLNLQFFPTDIQKVNPPPSRRLIYHNYIGWKRTLLLQYLLNNREITIKIMRYEKPEGERAEKNPDTIANPRSHVTTLSVKVQLPFFLFSGPLEAGDHSGDGFTSIPVQYLCVGSHMTTLFRISILASCCEIGCQ